MKLSKMRSANLSVALVVTLLLQLLLQPLTVPTQAASSITGLTLEMIASKSVVEAGESFYYEIKYESDGTTLVGKEIEITATVPSQFQIENADDWDSISGQTITLRTVLTEGASGTLRIDVKADTASNVPTTNTASVKVLDTNETLTATAPFLINNVEPLLVANMDVTSNTRVGPLSVVPFTLQITNDSEATGPYNNPVIYDLLPDYFNYYLDPKVQDINDAEDASYTFTTSSTSSTPKPKLKIVTEDFNLTGRMLVKWYWDDPVSFEPGTSFEIGFSGQVEAGTKPSNVAYVNDLYLTTSTLPQFWPEVDEYFVHESVTIPVLKSSQVQSTIWNQGDLQPIFRASDNPLYIGAPAIPVQPFESAGSIPYTKYPYHSVTYEGGTANYKLVIFNSGNTRLGKIDVIDILPHVGDYAINVGSSLEARGSKWRPNLAEVIKSGQQSSTSTPETGSKMVDFNLSTFYSKSVDQDRTVNFSNVTGSRTGWIPQSSFTSDDLTDIQSLYFEISKIKGSDGADGLAPGDYFVLDWKMDAPVGAPTNSVAWNSFAIQATEFGGGGGEGSQMLPTASNKVGFIVHPNDEHVPLGELGNFVWFDSNGNGIQNDSYPGDNGQAAGINGITVNLYKSGDTKPLKSSKTGYHYDGRPGYYLFQGLEAGDYIVEFVLPDHYKPTSANRAGADPEHQNDTDSQLVTQGATVNGYTPYRTKVITINNAEENPTIDFGLVESAAPSKYPAVKLDKKITSVAKGTSTDAPSQQFVVNGNVVNYAIELMNTSTVTLHNIKISDRMDRGQSGFQFSKLVYDSEEIVLNGANHGRPDIISHFSNTGVEPYVTVKSLDPGKKIVLEGSYTVAVADLDMTKLENTITVYYNESPKPAQDREEIITAGFTGSIGDYVWIDQNENGLQDVNEVGLNGVTVQLLNGQGNVLATTTTDTYAGNQGYFLFEHLSPGNYQLKFVLPSNLYKFTSAGVGTDSSIDSDANPFDGLTQTIALALGEANLTLDAGITQLPYALVEGRVWLDANKNGIQDLNEEGINGIEVELHDEHGLPLAKKITADHLGTKGKYIFDNLAAGKYVVKVNYPSATHKLTSKQSGTDRTIDSDINADGTSDLLNLMPGDATTVDAGLYTVSVPTPSPMPEPITDPIPIPTPSPKPTSTPKPVQPSSGIFFDLVDEEAFVSNMKKRFEQANRATAKTEFTDIQGHWAEKTIELFVQLGLANGYGNGNFNPNGEITRAEFAALLARIFDFIETRSEAGALNDIDLHWAKADILKLVEADVIKGYGDSSFRPNQEISREEVVAILSRIVTFDKLNRDTAKGHFGDLLEASAYARDAIQAAAEAGIVNGKQANLFDPKGMITRAEALVMIMNVMNLHLDMKNLFLTDQLSGQTQQ